MLPKSLDTLRIDINSGKVRKAVSICQNDTVQRTLNFQLVDSGSALDIDNVLFAEILIHKADGYEADNGCVIDGDSIQYTLRSTDIAALGTNLAQLQLTFKDGQLLTTPTFEINVYSKVLDQRVQESLNEYTALTEKVIYVADLADQTEEAKDIAVNAASTASEQASKAATYNSTYESFANATSEYAESASAYASEAESDRSEVADNLASTSNYLASASEFASTADSQAVVGSNYLTSTSEYMASAAGYASAAASDAILGSNYLTSTSEYASEAGSDASVANSCANAAEYWHNQTEAIAASFEGTLFPMGTVTFENLPAIENVQSGWMYNISDEFTTSSDFLEGSGHNIPEGSNVYLTAQNKWDILAGSPVTGIKGDNEQVYRKGNVNITKGNIGLGNVRNEDIGDVDISGIGATVKAAIKALFDKFADYQIKLTNPLTKADVVNNLTTDTTDVPLSAAQGKTLNDGKVAKSGDTMTGNLFIEKSEPTFDIVNTSTNAHTVRQTIVANGGDYVLWDATRQRDILRAKLDGTVLFNGIDVTQMRRYIATPTNLANFVQNTAVDANCIVLCHFKDTNNVLGFGANAWLKGYLQYQNVYGGQYDVTGEGIFFPNNGTPYYMLISGTSSFSVSKRRSLFGGDYVKLYGIGTPSNNATANVSDLNQFREIMINAHTNTSNTSEVTGSITVPAKLFLASYYYTVQEQQSSGKYVAVKANSATQLKFLSSGNCNCSVYGIY